VFEQEQDLASEQALNKSKILLLNKHNVLFLNKNDAEWCAGVGMPFGNPDWTPKLECHFAPDWILKHPT